MFYSPFLPFLPILNLMSLGWSCFVPSFLEVRVAMLHVGHLYFALSRHKQRPQEHGV